MSTITLGNLPMQASALEAPTMVVNESGQVVGTFYPVHAGPIICPISKEELDRRAAEPGGRTTQEILAELKAKYPI